LGTLTAGAVESSNVDLSSEMANLITAQRAFEANSKTITTANEVLQTLVQLKQNYLADLELESYGRKHNGSSERGQRRGRQGHGQGKGGRR
jgi:hypothetical protein